MNSQLLWEKGDNRAFVHIGAEAMQTPRICTPIAEEQKWLFPASGNGTLEAAVEGLAIASLRLLTIGMNLKGRDQCRFTSMNAHNARRDLRSYRPMARMVQN
jgi:hypothetical protein